MPEFTLVEVTLVEVVTPLTSEVTSPPSFEVEECLVRLVDGG